MRQLVTFLTLFFALCSPAFASGVTNVSVDNTVPTNATAARTTYVLGFITSATGALGANDRIRVTFPIGTGFAGWVGGVVRDVAAAEDVGNCGNPSNSVVECTLFGGRAIAANREVRVTFNGVNNAGTFDQHRLTVSTTPDADVVNSPFYTVVPAGQLSQITLANAVPSAAARARTNYVLEFKTSATGAMTAQANSGFDVTFPPTTGFLGWAGGTVRDVTRGVDVGNCSNPLNAAVGAACSAASSSTPATRCGSRSRARQRQRPGHGQGRARGHDVGLGAGAVGAVRPSSPVTRQRGHPDQRLALGRGGRAHALRGRLHGLGDRRAREQRQQPHRRDVPRRHGLRGLGGRNRPRRHARRRHRQLLEPRRPRGPVHALRGPVRQRRRRAADHLPGVTNGPAGAGKSIAVKTTSDLAAVNSAPFSVVAGGSCRRSA